MSFTHDRQNVSADMPTQDGRSIAIETPLGKDAVILIALDGVDQVSRGFVYTVEFMTRASDDQIRTLLVKPVTVWLHNASETTRRPLHGHVRHLTRLHRDARGSRRWRAEIVPQMWFLTCSIDCRIYQNLSPVEIISSIFDEFGLSQYQFRLLNTYPRMIYCVQYRESTFDFVSRLLEQEGISYWFEHAADRHMLVLSDSNQLAPFCHPRKATLSERSDLGEIQEITQDFAVHTGHWALSDFDFEMPTKNLRTRQPTIFASMMSGGSEKFDYPGHYTSPDQGQWQTRLRIEEEEVCNFQMSGLGSCAGFDPGRRFEFDQQESFGAPQAAKYFLTEVRHTASDPSHYGNTDQPSTYSNRFVCIPAEVPFRPERLTPRPVIPGLQSATVVGPSGESIHVDKYGRIRVLFHWDRRGKRDEHASCWIRVSQAVAGAQYGSIAIPHVGHEVIVSFLEGDPDRPLVIGNVHNGRNMPPIALPGDKNKTMLRDHGDNKIIMQGNTGKQHLSLVSPRSVNLFAVRNVAKSLSAAATIDGVNFEDFDDGLDGKALNEMQTIYTALTTGAADTNPTGTTLSQDATAGTADAGAKIDINSMSEGSINGLSVGNTNAWVGNDSNTWVNHNSTTLVQGDMNTTVQGDTNTTITGKSRTLIGGESITELNGGSSTKTWPFAISSVIGTNDTFVGLDNNSLVGGLNMSCVVGLNMSATIGGNLTYCNPESSQLFTGMNAQITLGIALTTATSNVQHFDTNIQNNEINFSNDVIKTEEVMTKCTTAQIKMINSLLLLIQ